MANQQILEKAIQKAINGGWGPWNAPISAEPFDDTYCFRIEGENWPLEVVIFNHDFAKALWGEKKDYARHMYAFWDGATWYERDTSLQPWQYHLQQMVIADDPIKYLGDHLDD